MSHYLTPARFNRIFEMDRNGPPMCGTIDEQQIVRDAISTYIEWNNPFDRTLFALTKKVKIQGRKYLVISLQHDERAYFWGRTGGASIQLFPPSSRVPSLSEWSYVLTHEIGHLMGMHLFNPQDRTESWAVQFQNWVMNGQSQYGRGYVYSKLDEAGAMDSVVVPS